MNNNSTLFPDGPGKYIQAGQKKMIISVFVIIAVMIACILWSCFGYINISQKTIAFSDDGMLYVVVKENMIDSVGIGTKFTIDGVEYVADYDPFEVYHIYETEYDKEFMSLPWIPQISKDEYLTNFGLKESPLPEGWYVATILLDRCHPIKLLF